MKAAKTAVSRMMLIFATLLLCLVLQLHAAPIHSIHLHHSMETSSMRKLPSTSVVPDLLSQISHYELTQPLLLRLSNIGDTQRVAASLSAAEDPSTSVLSSLYQHPSARLFEVTAFGKQYQLIVKPTEMFGEGYKELIMNESGEVIDEASDNQVQTDCWWEGHVIGDPSSLVTLSTCDHSQPQHSMTSQPHVSSSTAPLSQLATSFRVNSMLKASSVSEDNENSQAEHEDVELTLSGSIRAFGEQLFIEPGHPHSHRLGSYEAGSHIVYRAQDIKPRNDTKCGHPELPPHQQSVHQIHDTSRRLLMNGNQYKFVEVFVMIDSLNWKQYGSSTLSLSKSAVLHARSLYMNATGYKFAYTIDVRLVLMAALAYSDPWDRPTATSSFEVDASDLILKWANFAYSIRERYPHDQATLMSGYNFEDSVIGRGYLGMMCTPQYSAAVMQATWELYNDQLVGFALAHEMGHNFNMNHDPVDGYIMSPSAEYLTAGRWSQTSVNTLNTFLDSLSEDLMCLENVPTRNWVNITTVCGDGIIESGEECDCGSRACSEVDPCCDQATCLLKWNANCSVADGCCDPSTCTAYNDTRICRGATHPNCDIAERCDGKSSYCPFDTYAKAGTSCKWNSTGGTYNGTGKCLEKSCYSHAKQCAEATENQQIGVTNGQCSSSNNDNSDPTCGGLYCIMSGTCSGWNVIPLYAGTPCGPQKQCNSSGSCVSSSTFASPPNITSTTAIRRRANYTAVVSSTSLGSSSSAGSTAATASTGSSSGSTGDDGSAIYFSEAFHLILEWPVICFASFLALLQSL